MLLFHGLDGGPFGVVPVTYTFATDEDMSHTVPVVHLLLILSHQHAVCIPNNTGRHESEEGVYTVKRIEEVWKNLGSEGNEVPTCAVQ